MQEWKLMQNELYIECGELVLHLVIQRLQILCNSYLRLNRNYLSILLHRYLIFFQTAMHWLCKQDVILPDCLRCYDA